MRGAGLILLAPLAVGLWRLAGQPFTPDPLPVDAVHAALTEQRLDPNTADWTQWARLPEVGTKLAQKIVETRAVRQAALARRLGVHDPDAIRALIVFRTRADLLSVSGVGEKTLAQFERYVAFPASAPARPAP